MNNRLTVHTLGQLTITLDGQPLTSLSSRTAEALLVYLICEKRPFSRQFLADFLWDERTPERAAANLRTLLTMMRKSLGDFLHITRQSVAIDPESDYWLDALVLQETLTTLAPVLKAQAPLNSENLAALQTAVDLYQGNFLEGFYLSESRGFEEWMLLMQERLQRQVQTALQQLVSHSLANGLYEKGITYANRLLALDPFYEKGHRQLMWLLVRHGQRNAALQQYQRCRQILVEELAVEPAAATTAVYEKIRALNLPPPCHLPGQPGPFIGREEELTAVTHQLSQVDCRLLTMIGPGGMGKTSLAVETARRLHRQQPGLFLDGVFFVPLDAVEAAVYLPQAIAEKVGLTFQGAADPAEQLVNFLADRELLLVLDNFEHLLGEPAGSLALLARLLVEAPAVKLLVTSRHRLNLREEWLFDLTGLSYPPPTEDERQPANYAIRNTQYEQYSALQFFVQQAQRLRHTFSPSTEDWQAITRLCQLLEGLPLGLELAAAWIRQTDCAGIVARLEQSPEQLATSLYNVPDRHRSLTAVFHHSWALLAESEQLCFARLSIFRGGFTQAAAEAVAQTDLPTLLALVDKSLLRQAEVNDRFTMHPLLRQFAADQLAAGSLAVEQPLVADRHADFYLNLLVEPGDQPPERITTSPARRAAIQAELPNIRAAWSHAVTRQDYAMLDPALVVLHDFYSVQSWFQEGIEVFDNTLARLGDRPATGPLQAQVLCELYSRQARMHIQVGQLVPARRLLEQARPYLPQVTNLNRRATILLYMAINHYYAGDFRQAAALAEESLHLVEAGGQRMEMAAAYNFLGSCAKALGEYDQARHYFQQAVDIYHQEEEIMGKAMAMNNLGNLAQVTGDYEAARAYYEECGQIFKAHNHLHGAATTLFNAGRLAAKQGDHAEARQLLQESLALKQEIKDERGTAVSLSGLSEVSLATGEYEQARRELTQALRLAHELDEVKLTVEIVAGFGLLALAEGDMETAVRLLHFVDQHRATAQEVRQRIEPALTGINDPSLRHEAGRWAKTQTLDQLVGQLVDQSARQ
jgi:DNA-binding SARP family transcriptional activator/predicted ATPase/Flp pilus assembly protein TadD